MMRIDYSQAAAWHVCPAMWQEKYQKGIEFDWDAVTGGIGFGRRMHQLLEEYYAPNAAALYPPSTNEATEDEAQRMFAAYKQEYILEALKVLAVETTFEVPLDPLECPSCKNPLAGFGANGEGLHLRAWKWINDRQDVVECGWCGELVPLRHSYTGKVDLIGEDEQGLWIMDHKTEKRGGSGNTAETWATKPQVALYKWAIGQLWERPVQKITINVLTRQSEKGLVGPSFSRLEVGKDCVMVQEAVQDLVWVADTIKSMQRTFRKTPWPKDRDRCKVYNSKCQYYDLHLFGESDEIMKKFKPVEKYLGL